MATCGTLANSQHQFSVQTAKFKERQSFLAMREKIGQKIQQLASYTQSIFIHNMPTLLSYISCSQIQIKSQMNILSLILLVVTLLKMTISDITETHFDIPASLNMANVALLTRIDKIMLVDYQLKLVTPHIWTQHPDFKTVFNLPFSQYVEFRYNINTGGSGPCVLATRVKIDGVEIKQMRMHIANIQWPNLSLFDKYYMIKGIHTVTLEYRTSCDLTTDPNADWPVSYFRVSYLTQTATD